VNIDPASLAIIAGTLLLAGTVKGVIGLGLPTVTLGLLTAVFDLTTAMVLMVMPSLVTNLWQSIVGGNGLLLVRRIWPFLLLATVTIWFGAAALSRFDLAALSALLGLLLITYAAISLTGVKIFIAPRFERWAGPLFGTINGLLTGMTGSFVVPGVMYLQSIGLPRDQLVQAMGMLFSVSTLALGIALQRGGLFSPELGWISLGAVIPAISGMVVGQRIRQRLSEARFRLVFFCSILVLGAYIVLVAAGVL
jgi:uncharacterized membrane protein YfcA